MIRGSRSAIKRKKSKRLPVNSKKLSARPKVKKRIATPKRRVTKAARPKKRILPKREMKPKISKKQIDSEAKFASMMNEIMGGAKSKAITNEEIKEFRELAIKEKKLPLAQKVRNLLEEALESGRRPSRQTLNNYVQIAINARAPKQQTKVKTVDQLVKKMVARKIPGMPKLKPKAVKASLHLAASLENKSINFKKWAHEKKVV